MREVTLDRFWSGFGVIFVCFFLSGATGLVYEVIWLRMLGLVFGHTVYAITTVLAAFMAGLALGSFALARLVPRLRDLLRAYGYLEIGVGVSCALVPVFLWAVAPVYLGLHRALGLSYNAFSLVQFLLVFAILLVPTTLMGGTLPVLSQALVRQETELGRKVGALYAVNTFGAVGGVVLAGYFLLPLIGNRLTIAIAVVANLVVGALAIWYSTRRAPVSGGETVVESSEARGGPVSAPLGAKLTVAALGVSGAVSMVYEVAWTRAIALIIGSSTYAFTAMLVAFLVGIASGSALYSWLAGRRRGLPAVFAFLQIGIAVAVALVLLVFERIPELFLAALAWSDSPPFVQVVQFVVSASALLLGTLLIGATFPCAVAVAAQGVDRIGRDVGHVYAVNTLGAIVGTVIGGFLLIPTLGVHGTIKTGVIVNLVVGAVLLLAGARPVVAWRGAVAAATVALAVGIAFLGPWDPRVMSSGPAVYGKAYLQRAQQQGMSQVLRSQKLLFYRDGASGTVSVDQDGPYLFLRNNGKMDAGTAIDMPTQLMLGHLPMLVHPDPRRVLVIGLGSGITAGSVARHPVERIDIAEIEPAVVEANRFFARENGDVLHDPRVRLVIGDGRNFLLTTRERYDVIISEPSNPWVGGLASLFSVEFFDIARRHLRPGGMMMQWVHGYSLFPHDLQMVVRTFLTAFPSVTVWNTIQGDYLLLGETAPAPLDLERIKDRYQTNPGVWQSLDRFGIGAWPGVLGYFMLGPQDVVRYAAEGAFNTDDRLPLEFSAPRALYVDTALQNWRLMRSFRTADLPPVTRESEPELERGDFRYWFGMGYLSRQVFEDALPQFEHALRLQPGHTGSLLGVAVSHLRLGRPQVALELAEQVLGREPANTDALFLAGRAYEELRAPAQAMPLFERAVALQPQNAEYVAALRRLRGG